jgi:hypothetical protein
MALKHQVHNLRLTVVLEVRFLLLTEFIIIKTKILKENLGILTIPLLLDIFVAPRLQIACLSKVVNSDRDIIAQWTKDLRY